jgi:1-deoxy-D-xylulose-5-phosphate reductoisomerase
MRLPIQIALGWPDRLPEGAEPLDWTAVGSLDFEPVDRDTFRCLDLAFEAARRGGTYPAVMNAANEEAVSAFLDEQLGFTGIPSVVEEVLAEHSARAELTIDGVLDAERWARDEARARIETCS